MRKSLGPTNPKGAMKVKACLDCRPRCDPAPLRVGATPARLVLASAGEAEQERTCWDPKDGELCLSRSRPEETLVEDRSDSDVQIDRRTWV